MRKILLSLLLWSLCSVAYARPDFLVDADWLAEHIDDENLVVLEVRYHPHRYYTLGHIPGAVQVQRFKDLGDNHAVPLMRFPSHGVFQQRLRGWGVNDVRLYNGGWSHWGNELTLPVVEGDKPYSGDYEL